MHVNDQVSALYAILRQGIPGSAYIIGAGRAMRNRDLAERICDLLDTRPETPDADPRHSLFSSPDDGTGPGCALDPSRLARDLGWRPSHDFDEALKETVDWFLANRPVK